MGKETVKEKLKIKQNYNNEENRYKNLENGMECSWYLKSHFIIGYRLYQRC